MLKSRKSLAIIGAVCIFLLVVTGFMVQRRPSGHFRPSFSGVQTSSTRTFEDGVSAPHSGAQLVDESAGDHSIVPSDALKRQTRFEGYNLSLAECDAEFKDLFREIERATAHRKNIGNISKADIDMQWIDDGAVRAMIYRQKLFILESKLEGDYHLPRALSILHQIDRAITASPEPVPDVEFSFVVKDIPDEAHENHTYWALSRLPVDKETWLMPDFGYWAWPLDLVGAYEQIRVEMIQNDISWEEKTRKLLWRGALKTNKVRETMYRVTRGKGWADVEEVSWKNRTEVSASSVASAIPIANHCNYQFLLHIEGRSYSGRGKYLLNCGSVVIVHKSEWIEPHHDVYIKSGPDQNIVEVERDFSDLEEKMHQLLKYHELAKSIAIHSQKTFRDRFLTPAAQACYWRKLFHAWADVSSQPEPFEAANGKIRLRGIPFETFVIKALSAPVVRCSLWKKLTLQC